MTMLQDVHAPLLSLQGVKIVVVAVFFGFAFASIVSHSIICLLIINLNTWDLSKNLITRIIIYLLER